MPNDDIVLKNREKLIDALSTLKPEWISKLDLLKLKAAKLAGRPDVVWHMVVQSLSGMGNNRGYFNLIENQSNYNKICWSRIASLSAPDLLPALTEALSAAQVRWPRLQGGRLYANYHRIMDMGGIEGARQKMGLLRGFDAKFHFFQQFEGIGAYSGPSGPPIPEEREQ